MTQNRIALERTIGRIVLDRLNGYEVPSVAEIFKQYGGDDPVTMSVLERSFGNQFQTVAEGGRRKITEALAKSLRDELGRRGRSGFAASCSAGFRDMFFHCDPLMPLGEVMGDGFKKAVNG